MKRLLVAVLVLVFFQPNYAQKTIHPITKKKVKVFENEELSFYFPKSWRFIKHSLNDSIITIAPKHLLKTGYRIPQYYANTTEEIPNDFNNKTLKHPDNKILLSPVMISFFQIELKDSISFSQFVTEKINKYNKNFKMGKVDLIKKSNSHYIFEMKASSSVINRYRLQHYYLRDHKIQVVSFMSSEKYLKRHLKTFELLLSNATFKDKPKSVSTPHPKP